MFLMTDGGGKRESGEPSGDDKEKGGLGFCSVPVFPESNEGHKEAMPSEGSCYSPVLVPPADARGWGYFSEAFKD